MKTKAKAKTKMDAKTRRRMKLLDDMLDSLMRLPCPSYLCTGYEAPIRNMFTCFRCRCIHRAIQMKLVNATTLDQFSAIDGGLCG